MPRELPVTNVTRPSRRPSVDTLGAVVISDQQISLD
jgi:hypothetical protein